MFFSIGSIITLPSPYFSQAPCCEIYQLTLLYPQDATTKQMVAAHSQGLFLFEALHHLLEACKVLAQRRWDEAMGPSAQATPVSPPAVGLPAAALVAALPRTSGTGSTRSSTGDGAPPSSLSGKLKRVFSLGRRPSSSRSSNRVLPSASADDDASSSSAGRRVPSEEALMQQLSAGAMQRGVPLLHLTWYQLAVMERQRKLLVQLRSAISDVSRQLMDAFLQSARAAYLRQRQDTWTATTAPGSASEGELKSNSSLIVPDVCAVLECMSENNVDSGRPSQ